MAITAYYDTSGHEKNDPFVSCVGVIAPASGWGDFDREWKAVLGGEDIREFHHTDFKASQGEFDGWKADEQRRRRFMGRLLDVIERHLTRWYSSGIYPRTFASVSQDFVLDAWGGPFMLSAALTKANVDQWATLAVPEDPVLHVFEKGDHGQRPNCRLEDLGGDVVVWEKWNEQRGYIYGFQAADLIAGELTTLQAGISAEVDEFNRIGRAPLLRVFKIPGQIVNADAPTLRGVCRRFPHVFPHRSETNGGPSN